MMRCARRGPRCRPTTCRCRAQPVEAHHQRQGRPPHNGRGPGDARRGPMTDARTARARRRTCREEGEGGEEQQHAPEQGNLGPHTQREPAPRPECCPRRRGAHAHHPRQPCAWFDSSPPKTLPPTPADGPPFRHTDAPAATLTTHVASPHTTTTSPSMSPTPDSRPRRAPPNPPHGSGNQRTNPRPATRRRRAATTRSQPSTSSTAMPIRLSSLARRSACRGPTRRRCHGACPRPSSSKITTPMTMSPRAPPPETTPPLTLSPTHPLARHAHLPVMSSRAPQQPETLSPGRHNGQRDCGWAVVRRDADRLACEPRDPNMPRPIRSGHSPPDSSTLSTTPPAAT